MTDGNAKIDRVRHLDVKCLNTSSLDGREFPRVKDPARIRSCVTRSGEIVGVDDEVVVNDDGEEEEQAWNSSSQQAMMNTNGNNNYALVASPPGKSMIDDDVVLIVCCCGILPMQR